MIRRRIFYQGHVQGVGFRYTTHRIAANFDVTGYVKNLTDGRVEVVIEGQAKEIKAFMDELAADMKGYIRETTVIDEIFSDEFDTFSICH